jgi:hypothetical protein
MEINRPNAGKAVFNRKDSVMRVESKGEPQYGNAVPTSTQPVSLKKSFFENDTSAADKQTFTVDQKTTETFSWSLKEGISVGLKFSAKIPLVGKAGVEVNVSLESTQEWTNTVEKSWAYSAEVTVPAKSKVETSFIVSESKYSIPFTLPVQVRGRYSIKFNDGEFKGEIADLIDKFGWDGFTFDAVQEGTFKAVQGDDFTVKAVESALKDGAASSSSFIDAGVMQAGKTIRNTLPVMEKAAEQ